MQVVEKPVFVLVVDCGSLGRHVMRRVRVLAKPLYPVLFVLLNALILGAISLSLCFRLHSISQGAKLPHEKADSHIQYNGREGV
jgi:hypothetical protein